MVMVIGVLSLIVGLGSLICWILEIVAAFKGGNGPLMGILSIVLCGLGGFVIGWIHHKQWNITNLMIGWSACIVVSLLLNIVSAALMAATS